MGAGFLAGIASLATPILARILIALGLTVVTVAGGATVIAGMKTSLIGYINGAPLAGLQLAGLAGVWTGLGFVFGAFTFTMAIWGMTKAVRLVNGA